MEKYIKQIIDKLSLRKDKSVILAVSGGPDSVVLLDLFIRFFPKEKIVVAHANHGLRLEARWDESFVSGLAEEYGVQYICEHLQLNSTSEAAAREARYSFLEDVRSEYGARYVFTAHHLNDQAETILLGLVRGIGPLSAWGMSEIEGSIVRPLLSFPKSEVLKYAKKRHLRYHLDRTNLDVRYARNRIRSKVMPQLTKLNPCFLETLDRNASLGREMAEAWDVVLAEKQKRVNSDLGFDIKRLAKEPAFIQKELIKRKLESVMLRKDGISEANVSKVHDLLTLSRGKKTEIGSLQIIKGQKYLTFGKKSATVKVKNQTLSINQSVSFGGQILKMTKESGRATKNNILLPESIGYNLTIRAWREGDRILSRAGTKKLSDIFTDAKVSATERKKWPVVVSGRKVVWVPRLAACSDALSESKKKVIKIGVTNERKKK